MRVQAATSNEICIELSDAEARFLRETISSYPIVPNKDRELSKSSDSTTLIEATELLRSGLDEWTSHTRDRLRKWLEAAHTLSQHEDHWHLQISKEDVNWLLPVLNDLRVGSWHQLGCPSPEDMQKIVVSPEVIRPLWTMELTGILQSILLQNF